MKKFIISLFAVSIFMTACSQNENSKNQINENKMKSKTLIVYFSATGTTESVAKQLADILKADLHKIEPLHPYTADDLDWTNRKSRTSIEMNDKQFRQNLCRISYLVVYCTNNYQYIFRKL